MAIAGLVCAVVGAIVATVLTVVFVHAINKCGGLDNTAVPISGGACGTTCSAPDCSAGEGRHLNR